jgi:DNA-binding IclR family transcriptional regulator
MAVGAPGGTPRKLRTRSPARRASQIETRYAVPALDKGLDVLELLAREAGGLSLNEIARVLGRTSSELFRMVVALARRGYIEQLNGDRYTLTLKLFEMAHRHKPIKSLTAAAAPLMLELVGRALQSCHVTVFHAGRVMVVAEVDSPERYAFGMKVGALVGLTDTASGYVLLAFQDDNVRRAMLASHQEVEGELDFDPAQLAKIVRDVARKGYAEVQSRQTRGVTNIAFPIRGQTGHSIAVLNVPYIERIDKKVTPSIEVVKEMLRESAARLSLLMGYVTDAETSPRRQTRRRAHPDGVI